MSVSNTSEDKPPLVKIISVEALPNPRTVGETIPRIASVGIAMRSEDLIAFTRNALEQRAQPLLHGLSAGEQIISMDTQLAAFQHNVEVDEIARVMKLIKGNFPDFNAALNFLNDYPSTLTREDFHRSSTQDDFEVLNETFQAEDQRFFISAYLAYVLSKTYGTEIAALSDERKSEKLLLAGDNTASRLNIRLQIGGGLRKVVGNYMSEIKTAGDLGLFTAEYVQGLGIWSRD